MNFMFSCPFHVILKSLLELQTMLKKFWTLKNFIQISGWYGNPKIVPYNNFYVCMGSIIEGVRNNKYFLLLLILGKTITPTPTPQLC